MDKITGKDLLKCCYTAKKEGRKEKEKEILGIIDDWFLEEDDNEDNDIYSEEI